MKSAKYKNRFLVEELREKIPDSFEHKRKLIDALRERRHITSKRQLLLVLKDNVAWVSLKHYFLGCRLEAGKHSPAKQAKLSERLSEFKRDARVLNSMISEVERADVMTPRVFSLTEKKP